ncbi:hypothetical protein OESDEN_07808 [Oesophagostomum dentatum]|uniref:Uncharacterized protein n=1 Tax=Oesophagostomum dentatum TaxID=61180 RepID=A0A0B1T832_OESDE|nr:hypothetical protein OESDEN_07808 [Oesophagostomum dentatum]
MHKQIYENYKLCFPKADRHVGYQLLHIVKDLIEKGKREELYKSKQTMHSTMSKTDRSSGLDISQNGSAAVTSKKDEQSAEK